MVELEYVIWGYHEYKCVWSLEINERLNNSWRTSSLESHTSRMQISLNRRHPSKNILKNRTLVCWIFWSPCCIWSATCKNSVRGKVHMCGVDAWIPYIQHVWNPLLMGATVLKCGNAIKIRNGIMLNFSIPNVLISLHRTATYLHNYVHGVSYQ